jgi:hypothetical protein
MWLPKVSNPYCAIPTYALPSLAEQAASLDDKVEGPMILVSGSMITESPAYSHFLLAHECCHHSLGHLQMYKQHLGQMGPQPFFYIKPALRGMELDADCCAVRLLKEMHDEEGIAAGEAMMASFGDQPTGAYYPTGSERALNIAACAGH